MKKGKNWKTVLEYAESIRDGKKIACPELIQGVKRFFNDLKNPDYEIDFHAPEFCIGVIERTLCHQQGESLDGTPLRGKPFQSRNRSIPVQWKVSSCPSAWDTRLRNPPSTGMFFFPLAVA